MAKKGQQITNKLTGEEITWIETSSMTSGEYLKFKLNVAPKGYSPVKHIHPKQDEKFEIKNGRLRLSINGKDQFLTGGQSFTVKRETAHNWWNDSDDIPVEMIITLKPALKSETFFEQLFGLANDEKTDPEGKPNFMQIMVMSPEYDIYAASPPIFIQKIISSILGPIARKLGYKKSYKSILRGL